MLQKREYCSALGSEGSFNVSLGMFGFFHMLGLFQITDLQFFFFFFESKLQNSDIKVLVRKLQSCIRAQETMCSTAARNRVKIVGCKFFSHLQEICIPSSTLQISPVCFSNLRLSGGFFPLKKGKVTKKSSVKVTSPKKRLFNANLRYTSAQQSTADRTLALKDFLPVFNLFFSNCCSH